MMPSLKTLLSGCGAVALAAFWSGAAMAQYYSDDGYQRRYERRGYDGDRRGYDGDRRRYDRGEDRGYDRGYERARRDQGYGPGPGPGAGRGNPMNQLSLEEQKRAIKNHREAQKKAIKRGYVIP